MGKLDNAGGFALVQKQIHCLIATSRILGDLREKYLALHHSKYRFLLIQLNCPPGVFPLLFSPQKEN